MSRIFVMGNKDDIQTATADSSFSSILIQYSYFTLALNSRQGCPYPSFKKKLYQSILRITQTDTTLAEGCIIFQHGSSLSLIRAPSLNIKGIRAAHGEIEKINGLWV